MRSLKSLSVLIGLGLLGAILWSLDFKECGRILARVDLRWFLLALLLGVPEILLKSLRLKSFVNKAKSHITLKQAIASFLSGQPLAAVTPGKLGDVTRIGMLHQFARLSMPSALAVHAADRIYDLAAVLLLALVGLVSAIAESSAQGSALATLIGMLAGMMLILFLLNPRGMRFILKPLIVGIMSKKTAQKLAGHGQEFYDRLQSLLIPSFRLFGPFTLSFLAWETAILRAYLCAVALNLPLAFLKFLLLAPVMIMVELIPVSILGFGPREQAMFALFTSPDLTHEALMAFDLLIVLAGPVFVSLIGIPAASQLLASFKGNHEKK